MTRWSSCIRSSTDMIPLPASVSIRAIDASCSRSCTPPMNWSQSRSAPRTKRALRSLSAIVRWITRDAPSPRLRMCRARIDGSWSISSPCGSTHSEISVPSGPITASTAMNSRTPRTQLYRGIFSGSSGERVEGRTARFFSFVERGDTSGSGVRRRRSGSDSPEVTRILRR